MDQLSVDIRSSVRPDNGDENTPQEFSHMLAEEQSEKSMQEVHRYSIDSRLIREYVIKEMQLEEQKR